jgi:hypothetical protein
VQLTSITPGAGEEQLVRVVVDSTTNSALLPVPQFVMMADQQSGEFILRPVAAQAGLVTVWFYLEDSGDDGNFDTWQDNSYSAWQSLTIDVTPTRARVWTPSGATQEQRPAFYWTDVPEAVEYRVWIDNNSTGARPQLLTTVSFNSWQPEQDLGLGRYDVWIQAVKADGTRLPWSLRHSFEINTGVFVSPVPARIPTARPTVNWAPVTGADAYEVYVTNLSTGRAGVIREFVRSNNWTPSLDLDLSKYRIWVRAVIRGKYDARWSGARDFTVATPPVITGPISFSKETRPEFQWQAVAGADKYGFQLRNAVTGKVVIDVRGLNSPRFTPATPLAFGKYRWWAIAESAATGVRSDWSTGVDLIISDRPVLLSPSGTVSSQNLTLKWMPFPGAVSYEVWLNRSQPAQFILSASGLTQTEYALPSPLVPGVAWRFWTRAVSADGVKTPWSQPMEFTVAGSAAFPSEDSPAGLPEALEPTLPTVTASLHGILPRPENTRREGFAIKKLRDGLQDQTTVTTVTTVSPDATVATADPVRDAAILDEAVLQAVAELYHCV